MHLNHKRTFIRVKYSNTDTAMVELNEVWPNFWFQIKLSDIPRDKRSILHPGFRCWVTINSNVTSIHDLVMTDWSVCK